jgi:hypothetical protein
MQHDTHYSTVTEALSELRKRGFITDFNLEENCISCTAGKFNSDEFEIVDVYRYEGNTDPADEATVYAIESKSGIKGVLVTGYGVSEDSYSSELLRKLGGKH